MKYKKVNIHLLVKMIKKQVKALCEINNCLDIPYGTSIEGLIEYTRECRTIIPLVKQCISRVLQYYPEEDDWDDIQEDINGLIREFNELKKKRS